MMPILKTGDVLIIAVEVPEGYEGIAADLAFEDYCNEPHGWAKTLESVRNDNQPTDEPEP
jgi:hypothetical protein